MSVRKNRKHSSTFQRTVLAVLRGTDGGFCHFQRAVLAALCSTGVCLCFLFNVYFASKIISTSLRSVDIIVYGLTIQYVNLLTI